MKALSAPMRAPAWFFARQHGRVRLVECGCGFTYLVPASKPLPEHCLACHHAALGPKIARWHAHRSAA